VLSLQYSQLNLAERSLQLTEQKTGKLKLIRLNSAAIAVIERRRQQQPSDRWLFQVHSHRAKDKPISRVSVSRVFKDAGDMVKLSINTHSMRKSRGMAMYKDGVPVENIAKVLNHSNTTSKLRYLGITTEEVLQTYDDYAL
jgi:integrase